MINFSLADSIDDAFDAIENQDYETALMIAELNQDELIDAENQLVRCLHSNIVDCPAFFTEPHSIVLSDKC